MIALFDSVKSSLTFSFDLYRLIMHLSIIVFLMILKCEPRSLNLEHYLIYLDNCCFNRPYDDQSSLVIYLETQAKLAIQESIKNNKLFLAWSFILDYENSANPDDVIKEKIMKWKSLSSVMVRKKAGLIENAKHFMEFGLGNKDALHLASACDAKADFFITVDKGIIKKRNLLNQIQLMNPVEFINYLEEKYEN